MTDDSVKKSQPEISRPTVTTYDATVADLEDKDLFIDQYLHPKTLFQQFQLIDFTEKNLTFAGLDISQRKILIKVFEIKTFEPDEFVFKIGETANQFYIVRTGKFKASNTEKGNIREYYKGDLMNETVLLFPYTHNFNIQAITFGSLWYVDRQIFRRVKLALTTQKRKLRETYLAAIPLFRHLHTSDFMNLADVLETRTVKEGEFVYKQQSPSNGLYIVEKGVVHLCSLDDVGKQVVLYAVKKGGHFGERSMITCSPRKTSAIAATNIIVSFLRVASFERLKGFCKDIANEEDINDIFGSGINIFRLRQL